MAEQVLQTYHGNCHCGAFIFSVQLPDLKRVFACNCSICSKVIVVPSTWIEEQILRHTGNWPFIAERLPLGQPVVRCVRSGERWWCAERLPVWKQIYLPQGAAELLPILCAPVLSFTGTIANNANQVLPDLWDSNYGSETYWRFRYRCQREKPSTSLKNREFKIKN